MLIVSSRMLLFLRPAASVTLSTNIYLFSLYNAFAGLRFINFVMSCSITN